MLKNLLLLTVTLAFCYAGVELVFGLLLARKAPLPLVKFYTEKKETMLWAYDEHFNGIADFDLREGIPYRRIAYCCNADANPYLDVISPEQVPHAIEIVLNQDSIRDRDWRSLPDAAEITLVVGDSFCFGQGVRERDRFSNLIEEELNARRAPGSGTPKVLLALCRAGLDVRRVGLLLERVGGPIPNVKRVLYAYTLNDPVQDLGLALKQSYINDFMHQRARGLDYAHPQPEHTGTPLQRWLADRSLARKISRNTIEWYHELYRGPTWEQTQEEIRSMARFAQERGAAFTLVVFPLFHDFDDYPFADLHEAVVGFGRQSGFEVVDLFEAFAGSDAADFWVHPKDFHPNHVAHARVAELLLERLDW